MAFRHCVTSTKMADKGQAHLDSATRAATYNVALQHSVGQAAMVQLGTSPSLDARSIGVSMLVSLVSLRLSSFLLNAFVLRHITGELLGVVNMRLTLLYDTLLFISSEALRKACLSQTREPSTWQQTANLTWCSVPICLVSSLLLCTLWLSPLLEQPTVWWDPTAVVVFALSALLELLAEPLWVLAQAHHHSSLRVMAKGAGQVLKVLVVVLGTAAWPQLGLLAFCAGQVASSVVYVSVHYLYFWRVMAHRTAARDLPIASLRGLLPRKTEQSSFSRAQVGLGWSFFKQSFLKQLLTDGERYVMTLFGVLSFTQQGVYDVVNNLSSLVARFIFQPIEESFYVFFACTLLRGEPASRQPTASLQVAMTTLARLLKLVVVISLVILVFGYSYSHLALRIYGGALLTDSEGPILMRFFCAYIPLLALNGITECFFFALMSQAEIDRYNRKLLAFSAVFLGSALLLTRGLGSAGFVLANCVNMAVRIWHSCQFIQSFFENTELRPFSSAVPSRSLLAVLATCALVTATSEAWLYDRTALEPGPVLGHMLIGACCMMALLVTMATTERDLCHFLVERLPSRLQPVPLALLQRLHSLTL